MSIARVVRFEDTAAAWGSDLPPAASTPFLLGLAELACHALAAPELDPSQLSVGASARIEHLGPSRIGATLTATAQLAARDGRRLSFRAQVHDGGRLVARVEHDRAIVSRDAILEALENR